MINATPMHLDFLTAESVLNESNVQIPEKGIVQYNEAALPQQMISDMLFADVGGQELLLVSRWDTIDGQNVSYSLVTDLSQTAQQFNSSGILTGNEGSMAYFRQFSIDVVNRMSEINSLNDATPGIALNSNGDLVIDFDFIGVNESVEVEIVNSGTVYVF